MIGDKSQHQRFEKKYRLRNEQEAVAIREYLRSRLELDENSVDQPNYSYPVHSLYLDSDTLYTYWLMVNGDKNRFKLRLRYYDADESSPVFFEIKRRVNKCIFKQRGAVRREAVPWLLEGHLPEPRHFVSKSAKHLVALERFSDLMQALQARPKVHIAYLREAWVRPADINLRVTIDREVRARPECMGRLQTEMPRSWRPFGDQVILEIKFTDRFADWLREMVESFHLVQCSSAKYCESVDAIGFTRLGAGPQPPPSAEDAIHTASSDTAERP